MFSALVYMVFFFGAKSHFSNADLTHRLKLQVFGQLSRGRSRWSDARMPTQRRSRDRSSPTSIYADASDLSVFETRKIGTSATADGRRIVGQPHTRTRTRRSEISGVITHIIIIVIINDTLARAT